jgi:hypothetical protein
MAVDLGSRPFRTTYRPFRGSDQEVEIEWYPCAPGAKVYPGVSCISNPFWERDQFEFEDGELPLESVIPTGKPRTKPGTGKGHVCGSEEDHREGGLYLPDEPPVLYGMLGLPACCNPPVVMRGGVVDGGKAVVPVVPGQTCLTATPAALGETLLLDVLAGQQAWVRVPISVFAAHHMRVSSDPGLSCFVQTGPDCSTLSSQGFFSFAAGLCQNWPLSAGGAGLFAWVTFIGGAARKVFSLTVDAGTC